MRYIDFLSINFKQIQMFLKVAETENITLASQYLHISQSMLSKNIASIEKELGLVLFRRDKGRLHLTPAGMTLFKEWSSLSKSIEDSIKSAHCKQEEETATIRIGIPDSVNPDMYFFPTIQNFSNSYSQFKYRTEVLPVQSLIQKLNQHELDVIFTMLFDESALKRYDVEYHIILRHRLEAFMPRNGLLSYKDEITFQDLKTRKFVTYGPDDVPNYFENVILYIQDQIGVPPLISYYASSSDSVLMNTVDEDNIFVADGTRKIYTYTPLIKTPIKDSESGTILAWNSNHNNHALHAFITETIKYWNQHNNHL